MAIKIKYPNYQITSIIQINLDHCIRKCCRVQRRCNITFAGLNPRATVIIGQNQQKIMGVQ